MTSKEQNDIFGVVTEVDFSDYESIKDARKKLEDYGKKNNKMNLVQPFLNTLDEAAEKLVFNVNTLA